MINQIKLNKVIKLMLSIIPSKLTPALPLKMFYDVLVSCSTILPNTRSVDKK